MCPRKYITNHLHLQKLDIIRSREYISSLSLYIYIAVSESLSPYSFVTALRSTSYIYVYTIAFLLGLLALLVNE